MVCACACARVCVCVCVCACTGKPQFIHIGEEVDGVDMRAEVGLLSRNVMLRGEMEPGCYGNEACKFFDFDTFGGHLKVRYCQSRQPGHLHMIQFSRGVITRCFWGKFLRFTCFILCLLMWPYSNSSPWKKQMTSGPMKQLSALNLTLWEVPAYQIMNMFQQLQFHVT